MSPDSIDTPPSPHPSDTTRTGSLARAPPAPTPRLPLHMSVPAPARLPPCPGFRLAPSHPCATPQPEFRAIIMTPLHLPTDPLARPLPRTSAPLHPCATPAARFPRHHGAAGPRSHLCPLPLHLHLPLHFYAPAPAHFPLLCTPQPDFRAIVELRALVCTCTRPLTPLPSSRLAPSRACATPALHPRSRTSGPSWSCGRCCPGRPCTCPLPPLPRILHLELPAPPRSPTYAPPWRCGASLALVPPAPTPALAPALV